MGLHARNFQTSFYNSPRSAATAIAAARESTPGLS
jgi:hypothetical protein